MATSTGQRDLEWYVPNSSIWSAPGTRPTEPSGPACWRGYRTHQGTSRPIRRSACRGGAPPRLALVLRADFASGAGNGLLPLRCRVFGGEVRYRQEDRSFRRRCYLAPVNDAVRELFFRGANAFEAGDDAAATAAFQRIVERADVADDDKAMACVNLATVCDRSNDIDQALAWYVKAVALAVERRHFIEESRAAYLASRARYTEAIDGLTRLLQATDLQPADRLRLEQNLAEIQGKQQRT